MYKRGNTIIIVIIVLVLAIAAGAFYFLNQSSTPEADLPTPKAMMEDGTEDPSASLRMTENRYVQYEKAGYEQISGQKHVLFFYANWCPTCRLADAEFQERISEIPEGITLVRVNYNDTDTDVAEEVLASEHGITYQHTFVYLDGSGEEIARWNGGRMDELLEKVN